MVACPIDMLSEDSKIKKGDNGNIIVNNKGLKRFLMMNIYDLALENPRRAYNLLLKETMNGEEGNVKEKQELFNFLLMEIVELLEKNGYGKVAKTLLKQQEILGNYIEEITAFEESFEENIVEKEYVYDFENWLKIEGNRTLINFAYSFCADGEIKKAQSFLKQHIYSQMQGKINRKDIILYNAMNYIKHLIKHELGSI